MLFMAGVLASARNGFQSFVSRWRGERFGYDAADQAGNGKRRPPSKDLRHEDGILKANKRKQVQSSARDAVRNFTVAGFMVRMHLNYVTRARFQARTGHDAFDEQLEAFIAKASAPEECDLSGRFCLDELVRITEASAVLDGDLVWVKYGTGHVQLIESDRIRDVEDAPQQSQPIKTTHGVVVDDSRGGRHLAYAVHSRPDKGQNRYKFERLVPARNCLFYGFVERYDQTRGISAVVAGLNSLQDTYEGFDYSLAKLKAESLFGLKIKRDGIEGAGTLMPAMQSTEEGEEDEEKVDQGYQVDFGKGPVKIELEPGDDAEFMQSNSPGGQAQEFLKLTIAVVLKSLDLPFSFFDESYTNFFGSRAAWTHYDNSCVTKRERSIRLRNAWTAWRIALAIEDGELVVPEGVTPSWEWIPDGMAWWDRGKEAEADNAEVMAGYSDPESIARKRKGGSIYKNLEKKARIEKYAASLGTTVSWGPPPAPVLQVVEKDP